MPETPSQLESFASCDSQPCNADETHKGSSQQGGSSEHSAEASPHAAPLSRASKEVSKAKRIDFVPEPKERDGRYVSAGGNHLAASNWEAYQWLVLTDALNGNKSPSGDIRGTFKTGSNAGLIAIFQSKKADPSKTAPLDKVKEDHELLQECIFRSGQISAIWALACMAFQPTR